MSASPARQARVVPRFPHRGTGAAVDRARLTVVPNRRVGASRLPFVTLVTLLLVGGIVGLLCFNTQMQQASFAATELEQQATTLTAREQTLRAQLQDLRNPQRLAVAAQRHGLVIPGSTCTLSLVSGKAAGDCAPATADQTPRLLAREPARPKVLGGPVLPARHPTTVPGTTARPR